MMHNPLEQLHTEQRNTSTIGIASCTTLEMLEKINDEDQKVAAQVRKALPDVARAVELIVERMRHGGRLVYAGAGTSGRLGYMDAAECRPTYGIAENKVSCVMAGGRDAVFSAKESLEDDRAGAREDLRQWGLLPADVVVAAAASGRTPYCIGALDYPREIGAGAISIACNPGSAMSAHADVAIEVDTGAEAIMGSTRMKAGTAQKMIMNMLSTAAMVRLGRTYDNLMICLRARNGKIAYRMVRLYCEATGCTDEEEARRALRAADGQLDIAIFMQKAACTKEDAEKAFSETFDIRARIEKAEQATPTNG